MSLPAFTGSNTTILWQNDIINKFGDSVPPPDGWPYGSGDSTNLRTYNPSAKPIEWNGNVPSSLNGITLDRLSDLSVFNNFSIAVSYVFTVTSGSQTTICNGRVTLNFNIFNEGGPVLFVPTNIASLSPICENVCTMSYPFNGNFPSFTYNLEPGSQFPSYDIQAIAWNQNVGCQNYPAGGMTIKVDMNVTLIVTCQNEIELASDFCLNYCLQPDNQQTCFPQYEQFCLKDTGTDGNINLFTNDNCDTFIKQYLATQGPQATVDNDLNNACAQFTTVDEYNQQTKNVQNICACHLPQDIYDNLRNSLIQEFPGFQYVDENERCLFPTCPSSDYKTVSIGKVCALPACINIASVENNGTIEGGTQINQGSDCANAANQTGNNAGQPVEEAKTWIERHWPWVVLGISVLAVLIIIILVILASEGNKKKKK